MEKVPFGSENLGKLQGILCGLLFGQSDENEKNKQQISQSYQV